MKNENLRKKSIGAVVWSALEAVFKNGLQFIISVVLARLILPEEFGTIALLYLFTGITAVFIDSGFPSALVQRQNTTYNDECTVFWLNVILGVVASLLLWMASPLIAGFYDKPILTDLTAVLALSLFINSLGSIHTTLLTKELNFKKLMVINASATGVSGLVAIVMALEGYGVWALAAQVLVTSIVTTITLWATHKWRPSFIFSAESMRNLFAFGSYLMMSNMLDRIYMRLYTILLGKFYDVKELAFYSRADRTHMLPVDVLSGVLSRVAYPIFSATSQDKARLLRGLKLALEGIMLINVPMMLGLMATADSVVPVLFGDNWLPAVPILKVLCLHGVLWPVHVLNLNVLKAQGMTNVFFRLEIIKKIIGTTMIFACLPWGAIGVAWSQVISSLINFYVNAYYTKRNLGYGFVDQWIDITPVIAASAVMAGAIYFIPVSTSFSLIYTLLIQVFAGVAIYAALCLGFKIRAYNQFIMLLRERKAKQA